MINSDPEETAANPEATDQYLKIIENSSFIEGTR
jgi:hypothetical protein